MTSPSSARRQADALHRKVEETQIRLSKIDRAKVVELLRRREVTPDPDGYPSGGWDAGSASSEEWTPTERAALRGLPEPESGKPDDWRFHTIPDPIGDAITVAVSCIVAMDRIAKRLDRAVMVVMHAGDKLKGRQSTLQQCTCCDADVTGVGNDRIRSGYCPSCYQSWLASGRPDRPAWEKARRRRLAEIAEHQARFTGPTLPTR